MPATFNAPRCESEKKHHAQTSGRSVRRAFDYNSRRLRRACSAARAVQTNTAANANFDKPLAGVKRPQRKIDFLKIDFLKIVARIGLCLAFCALLWSPATAQKKTRQSIAFLTEGTFSNIAAGAGGDYGGMQIHLTDSDGQFYALVTIAEGVLQPPVLVKTTADIDARKFEFALPGETERKFIATAQANGMTLVEIAATKTAANSKSAGNGKQFLKRICQK